MKIVHITDYFQPQLGYQETALVKKHVKMGHDVTILTSDRYFPFKDYNENYKKLLGNRIVGAGESKNNGYKILRFKPKFEFGVITSLPQITKAIKSIKPDIVIHHNLLRLNIFWTLKARKQINFKLVADSHAAVYNSNFNSLKNRIYLKVWKKLNLKLLAKYASIVATGPDEKAFLKDILANNFKINIIPLGADLDIFKRDESKKISMRETLGVKDDEILFIHAGKFNTEKKTLQIIHALGKLPNNTKLLLVGNGSKSYFDQIRNNIDSNNLSKRVLIKNFVRHEQLSQYLNASDVGVWPGSKSNTFYEALASSLPVILENREYARELVSNNNGFNVSSKKELIEKMQLLSSDVELIKSMGKRSRELAEKKYNWTTIAQQFLEI